MAYFLTGLSIGVGFGFMICIFLHIVHSVKAIGDDI